MIGQGQPTTANELFSTINELLAMVVAVDNAIFRFRVRNLFKPMDFGQYHVVLEGTTNAFEELEVGLRLSSDYWIPEVGKEGFSVLLSYLPPLKEASAKLRDIAGKLDIKGKGRSYPHHEYQADLASYRRLVEAYVAYGNRMNDLLRQFG